MPLAEARAADRLDDRQPAALIVNTQSRRGESMFSTAVAEFARHGLALGSAQAMRRPDLLPGAVREAIAGGARLVIVGGGDGTITSVVGALAYQPVVLGLLPLGTGNSFARSLGIPVTLAGAIEVITQGRVATVDLGRAGDDYFANVASIGFTTEVARRTPWWLKRALGPAAYVLTGLPLFFGRRAFRCRLQSADKEAHIRTHQVTVANGSHFGLQKLTEEASANEGRLTILTMADLNRFQMLKAWADILWGRRAAPAAAHYLTLREVTVEAEPAQYIDIDGEASARTPVHFSVAAGALKVMAPPAFRRAG
jgi:YegS/Rv2252/BmrU family lipid kinase